MAATEKIYLAIDLKSFYASVECVDRELDPLTTNLVVADESRTEKTICLSVSPSLKGWGIPGRPRLFEVIQRVKEVNENRRRAAPGRRLTGASADDRKVRANPSLAVDYITAVPRMAHYMECSTRIYQIYLKYIAPEDIHVYSIDEVFIDITGYLHIYRMTAEELARTMIRDVLEHTGITATAGIGTNLYLAKVAMDIVAKHMAPDQNGVRIASLDELTYRKLLWSHRPLTDFWRVGSGYARKLEAHGLYTMGDIARCSIGREGELYQEELLYRLFGVNAELLIDHAWGWEPCTIADIKAYRPENTSLGSGMVVQCPYTFEKARLAVRELTDLLSLELLDKGLAAGQIVLTVGYDADNLKDPQLRGQYHGPVTADRYGRRVPKHAHGTENLNRPSSSGRLLGEAVTALYDRLVNPALLIRRINVTAGRIVREEEIRKEPAYEQLNLFTDYKKEEKKREKEQQALEREKKMQQAMLEIKKKYGKNAILKGMSLQEGAVAGERNRQIGGHKA